ncbi:hypothetical protein ACLB6G_12240 [Zhengella sp. ZM62]|uniref:hypothetical protein n=1 Tax=Zhengella sedimenti TaxID=3390035 RepID=UPI003976A851
MRLFMPQGVSMMTALRAAAAASGLIVAACTTASLEDAAPRSLLPPPSVPGAAETPAPAGTVAGADEPDTGRPAPVPPTLSNARDTGQFPNINVVPKGQTAQISPAQRAATVSELNAARNSQRASGAGARVGGEGELRRLGRTHTREALEEIESE